MKLMRAHGEMHQLDLKRSRASGQWSKQLFPEELSNREFEAGVQITMLRVRIRDESLRDLIKRLRNEFFQTIIAKTEAQSERSLQAAMVTFEGVNDRIGELVTSLDEEDIE